MDTRRFSESDTMDPQRTHHLRDNSEYVVEWLRLSGGIPIEQFQSLRNYLHKGTFKFNLRNILGEGMMFGDLGLLMGKPRVTKYFILFTLGHQSATIICREDTEFAILSAESYRRVLKAVEIQKINT